MPYEKTMTMMVYTYDDLVSGDHEDVKQNVLNQLADTHVDYEWWNSVYDDAKTVGIAIDSFDTGRGNNITGKVADLRTADLIMTHHGKECDTYKLAESFIAERDALVELAPVDEDGEFENESSLDDSLDALEAEFERALLEEYLSILRHNYEYYTSEEAILSTIEANGYEFDQQGNII